MKRMVDNKLWKVIVLFILTMGLAASAACGKGTVPEQPVSEQSGEWSDQRYAVKRVSLEYHTDIKTAAIYETKAFYVTYPKARSITQSIYIADLESGQSRHLEGFHDFQRQQAEENRPAHFINQLFFYQDRLYALTAQAADGSESQWNIWLLVLSSSGTMMQQTLLNTVDYAINISTPLCADSQNNLYVFTGMAVVIFDPEGQELGRVEADINSLVRLADGRVAAVLDSDQDQWQISPIDPAASTFSGKYFIPAIVEQGESRRRCQFFSGSGPYDFFCASDLSLYGFRLEQEGQSGTGGHILSWINCDMDGSGLLALEARDDSFSCVTTSRAFGGEMCRLKPKAFSDAPPVTLSLACRQLPAEVADSILRFNRRDTGVRVEIRDYGAVAAGTGLAAGIDRMTVDLLTGNTSDLFYTSGLDEQVLIDRELLEDLWPWIDSDTELGGREALVTPLFEAMSQNGALYTVTDGFQIHSAIGYRDVVGDRQGWSAEEFMEIYRQMPDLQCILFAKYDTREAMLEVMIATCAESFINRETWTASFDSLEFAALLEYINLFPEKPLESGRESLRLLHERRQMMNQAVLRQIAEFRSKFYKLLDVGPKDGTFIGFPGVAGNGAAFQAENRWGLYAGSTHK